MSGRIGLGLSAAAGALLLLSSGNAHADDRLRCARYSNDFTQHGPWELEDLSALALLLAETPAQCPELRRNMQTRIEQLSTAARRTQNLGGGRGGGGGGEAAAAGQRMFHINETRGGEIRTSDSESNGFRYDQYPLNVVAGDAVTVVLESSAVQPYVVIGHGSLPDDFYSLADARAVEGETRAELNFVAPPNDAETPTEHCLVVTSADQSRFGPYSVAVRRWDRPPPAPPRRIAFGTSERSTISEESARLPEGYLYEAWVFEGRAGQTVRVTMNADFDTYLLFGQMQGSEFIELQRNDDGGEGLNAQITYAIESDGDYVVYARPYSPGYAPGDYEIQLEQLQARPISAERVANEANGWIINGTLDVAAGLDEQFNYYRDYEFRTRRGRHYSASVSSYEFDAILDVGQAQRGGAVTPVDFYNAETSNRSQRAVLLDADLSSYVLRARSYDGGTGTFQIIVSELTEEQWQAALEERRRLQEEAAAAAAASEEPAATEEAPPAEAPPDPAAPPAQ